MSELKKLQEISAAFPPLPGAEWVNYERAIPIMKQLALTLSAVLPVEYMEDEHFWYIVARNYWDQRKRIPSELQLMGVRGEQRMRIRSLALKTAIEKSRERVSFEALVATDSLTGAFNRRALDAYLSNIMKHGRRGTIDALIFLDIDNFKLFNDTYGHGVGDVVLQQLIVLLKEQLRGIDMLGRYGGEEFVLIIPGVDAQDDQWRARYQQRIERLRETVERKLKARVEETAHVSISERAITASFGLAEIDDDVRRQWQGQASNDVSSVYSLADQQLYIAKGSGRNVVMWNGRLILNNTYG